MKTNLKIATASPKGYLAFKFCLWVFAGAGLLVTLVCSLLFFELGEMAAIRILDALKPWLLVWRIVLYSALMGAWPYWVNRYAGWAALNTGQRQMLLRYRWRFVVFLGLYECLLVQNILAELLA